MLKVVLGSSLCIAAESAYSQEWGKGMSIDDAVRG